MISSYLSILHTKWLKRHKQLAKFTKIPENFSQMQNMQIYVAKRTRTLRTNFQSNASLDKWLIACVVTDADRRKCTKKICKVNAATRKNMIRVKKCAHTEMKNHRAFLLFFLVLLCFGCVSVMHLIFVMASIRTFITSKTSYKWCNCTMHLFSYFAYHSFAYWSFGALGWCWKILFFGFRWQITLILVFLFIRIEGCVKKPFKIVHV